MDNGTGANSSNYLHSASYDLFVLVLTLFSLLVAIGLLLPLRPAVDAILLFIDFILCAFFIFDFLLCLRRAPTKGGSFVRGGGWLDLLGSIPAVAGLSWTVPPSWQRGAERPMRAATYVIGPGEGDAEPAECAVYYFGTDQGGGVQDNVERWISQFEQPDGRASTEVAITDAMEVSGLKVTTVEVPGTYSGSMGPMAGGGMAKENYRMLAAIVEGPEGAVFFKLTGPDATVDASRSDFDQLVSSIRTSDGT